MPENKSKDVICRFAIVLVRLVKRQIHSDWLTGDDFGDGFTGDDYIASDRVQNLQYFWKC